MIESPSPQHNTRRIDVGWCCSTATATAYDVPGLVVKPPRPALHVPRRRKEAKELRRIPKSRQHKPRQGTLLDLFRPKLA